MSVPWGTEMIEKKQRETENILAHDPRRVRGSWKITRRHRVCSNRKPRPVSLKRV